MGEMFLNEITLNALNYRMHKKRWEKYAPQRKDLVSCLTCGTWHEIWAICGILSSLSFP